MRFFRAIAFSSIMLSPLIQASTLVTVEDAKDLLMNPTRSAPAIVISLNQGNIPAQTSGVLTKVLANVGDIVNKGETLALVDCINNIYKQKAEAAKFSQLKTQLLFNKRDLKRGQKLVKQNNIGEAELDRMSSAVDISRSELSVQQAILDMAFLRVSRCSIKAPYTGVVTKRIASVGEMIEYGKPVIEMLETNSLEVSAKIANSDEASFKEARSYIVDMSGKQYKVTLRALLPVIESNARSREARFIFSSSKAFSGSTGRLRWESPIAYLPAHLLQKRDGKNGYFIVDDSKSNKIAKFIEVLSAEEGRPLLFNATLHTKIVTDGRHSLQDGDEVDLTTLNMKDHEDDL